MGADGILPERPCIKSAGGRQILRGKLKNESKKLSLMPAFLCCTIVCLLCITGGSGRHVHGLGKMRREWKSNH
eukprot:12406216-Karenia_brevis.AAC.1